MSDNNKKTPENQEQDPFFGRFGYIDISTETLREKPLEVFEIFSALKFLPVESHAVKKYTIARYFGVSPYFDFFEPGTGSWEEYPLYRYSIKGNEDPIVKVRKTKKGNGYYGIKPEDRRGGVGNEVTYEYHYPDYWDEFNPDDIDLGDSDDC